jgi:hypothetical protein
MNGARVNYIAVAATAILYWLIGAVWYSPWLFASQWLALIGKNMDELKKNGSVPYIGSFLANLVIAYVLARIVIYARAQTLLKGFQIGLILSLAFVATTSLTQYLFEGRSIQLFLINAGYAVVGMSVMGAILAVWRKHESPAS